MMFKVRTRKFSTLLIFAIYFTAILLAPAGEAQVAQKPKPETVSVAAPNVAAPSAQAFTYDVVSIRLPRPDFHVGVGLQWDGLRGYHVTVKQLMASAYGVRESQIADAPAWQDKAHFDVEAKMDEATAAALEKMPKQQQQAVRQQMLQAVLADRFQLKAHHATKVMPIYALVIAKSGLKLKPADPNAANPFGDTAKNLPWGTLMIGGGNPNLILTARGIPISRLVDVLNWEADRIVVDKTGLTDNYDLRLQWTSQDEHSAATEEAGGPPLPADPGVPLKSALEKQLGLSLNAVNEQMDTIIIDHVERPSEN